MNYDYDIEKIVAHARKLCAIWNLDADKEERYLREQVPRVCQPGKRPLEEWLNDHVIWYLAMVTAPVKECTERCRKQYYDDCMELQRKNGGRSVEVWSFEHEHDGTIHLKIKSVASQMEKFSLKQEEK